MPNKLKSQDEGGKTDARAKHTGENLRGREIRLAAARGILSVTEVSAGPEGGVACCLTLAALWPPVGVMAEVKLRVPGGERGLPALLSGACTASAGTVVMARGVRDPRCPGLSSCRSPGAF